MCLAVPGQIVDNPNEPGTDTPHRVVTVDFNGTRTEVSLAFTPDADKGDWVLVHAGFALQTLSEGDARQTWAYLKKVTQDSDTAQSALNRDPVPVETL